MYYMSVNSYFYAPTLRGTFKYALVCPSAHLSVQIFCDKGGKVGAPFFCVIWTHF